MFVIHHFCLKDIYMSFKLYVTYICCVILNNVQIHFQASRTYIHIHEWFFLAIYCCICTIEWHHLDSTLRRGARGSSLLWWDFSSLDLGLSRSNPRAACFLFKMYGSVNVCVCTYKPTSIGSLFLFSFCFQLFPRHWFHLPSATCVELHPRFFCDLWRSNPEIGIGTHQISQCSTPTHTPF